MVYFISFGEEYAVQVGDVLGDQINVFAEEERDFVEDVSKDAE